MKNLVEILTESKTSTSQMRDYIASWLRQDRENYDVTVGIILEAMIDFFNEEIKYDENNKEAKDLHQKLLDIYTDWDK